MQITIEGITLSVKRDGTYWMENENGEGTQVTTNMLRSKLQELFNELM